MFLDFKNNIYMECIVKYDELILQIRRDGISFFHHYVPLNELQLFGIYEKVRKKIDLDTHND